VKQPPSVDCACQVLSSREILPGVFSVHLQLPPGSPAPHPGQFVQVEPSRGVFPVTRRPFTVNSFRSGVLEIVFDVVGRGTALMASIEAGFEMRILGPLGKGWDMSGDGPWILIGGGLGAAGFQFLLDTVECSGVVLGARSASRLVPLKTRCPVITATEDGSSGTRGLITSILGEDVLEGAGHIALCGPLAMMDAVWKALPPELRSIVQVSTESRMGCGWGVCEGCSIPVHPGGYMKCCTDGPVFRGEVIDWDRWKEAGV